MTCLYQILPVFYFSNVMVFVRRVILDLCSMWWWKLFTFNTLTESLLRFMSTAALAFHLFKTIGIILSADLCCRCLNWAALWRRARFLWQQTELSRWDCRWLVRYAGARCSSSISMSRKHWKVVTSLHMPIPSLRSASLSDFTTIMALS